MKIKLAELPRCFGIELEAETIEDAAKLTRLAMNRTTELRHCETYVSREGGGKFNTSIVIGKRQRCTTQVPKGKQ